jgi:hypothetical protein
MTDITQQLVSSVATGAPPGLVFDGENYLLAWTSNDQNGTISWLEFSFDANNQVQITKKAAPAGFRTQGGTGLALTNFQGTPWMAYLENQADAPAIPGSRPFPPAQQPPVIMVSSLTEGAWSKPQALWNPGLINNDYFVPSYQGPAAIMAPAIAATKTEIMAVWVEYAVNGSDALALWSDGQPVSPTAQPQIFFATWTPKGGWTKRAAIADALTAYPPALVAANGAFYLAFKGLSDGTIWFAEHTSGSGWSKRAILPIGLTSDGLALGVDRAANLQIVFKGQSTSSLYWATLAKGTAWSASDPGKGWSLALQLPVVATKGQPTLASQLQATDLVLAYGGASHPDLFVVPLSAFLPISPPSSFGGGSNYILAPYPSSQNDGKNCLTLQSLWVTVEALTDIVTDYNFIGADHAPPVGPLGFSVQLNCYSPPGFESAWQQYIIIVSGTEIFGQINNWPLSGPYLYDSPETNLCSIPNANILPQGYQLNMELVFSQGLVTAVIFNICDNHGKLLMVALENAPQTQSPPAPITAFELNIVGPGNKQGAWLTGAGTITYGATPELYTWNSHPKCAIKPGGTDEGSNVAYGPLTPYPSERVMHHFDTSATTPIWPSLSLRA